MYVKLIQSGDLVEIYKYQYEPTRQTGRRKERIKKRYSKPSSRRPDNVSRQRTAFVRLIRANLQSIEKPAFLTLTMVEVAPLRTATELCGRFFADLRYFFGNGIRYIGVPEFQRRGAVHYHVLVWGLPEQYVLQERNTRYLQRLWQAGYVDIIPTDGSPKLATYCGKYMYKSVFDDRLAAARSYFTSHNVVRPVSVAGSSLVSIAEEFVTVDMSLVKEVSYDTLWLGRCDYKRYN